jgi:hypothetical protein
MNKWFAKGPVAILQFFRLIPYHGTEVIRLSPNEWDEGETEMTHLTEQQVQSAKLDAQRGCACKPCTCKNCAC